MKYIVMATLLFFVALVMPICYGLYISYGEWSGTSDQRYNLTGSSHQSSAGYDDASIQIFVARSARWRGVVAVHSWIALKQKQQSHYTRYEVFGWNRHNAESYIVSTRGKEDDYWYGYKPEKIFEINGELAQQVIKQIESEIELYPYANEYRAWPGPNSNTFTAYIARKIDAIKVDLPPTAVGKDFHEGLYFLEAPSNTGYQLGYAGVIGVMIAIDEGLEINLAGAVYGIDLLSPALKVPAVGRIDFFDWSS